MILMHEDWQRDTLQWSWICGRGMARWLSQSDRSVILHPDSSSGKAEREGRRQREKERERGIYIIRTTEAGRIIPRSVITSLRVESTGDRCRPSPRKAVARVSERINQGQVCGALQFKISNVSSRSLLRFWWISFVSWGKLGKGAVPLFLWTLWEDWESFELDSIRIWKFFYSVDDIRSANLIYYYENKLIFNLKKTGIRALEVLLYG